MFKKNFINFFFTVCRSRSRSQEVGVRVGRADLGEIGVGGRDRDSLEATRDRNSAGKTQGQEQGPGAGQQVGDQDQVSQKKLFEAT